jgi:ABC-type multidrug transport system fused ATPase/permease subunit
VIETKATGEVPWSVYWAYLKAGGGVMTVCGLLGSVVGISLTWLWQSYSMGHWLESIESGGDGRSHSQVFALCIYLASVLSLFAATGLKMFVQVLAGVGAARSIHSSLIFSVLRAECSWFDATPVGRIINRFSQDISAIDTRVIYSIFDFLDCFMGTAQIVFVIAVLLPILLVPLIPVIAFTVWVTYQFLHLSREIKRIESIKKSPVFVLVSESLLGLSVIRAFRQEKRFVMECHRRVDDMNICHLYMWMCNRWLNFRMQVLGAVVAGAVGLAVVMQVHSIGSTAAGVVLIYSLSFCDNLTFLARTYSDVSHAFCLLR